MTINLILLIAILRLKPSSQSLHYVLSFCTGQYRCSQLGGLETAIFGEGGLETFMFVGLCAARVLCLILVEITTGFSSEICLKLAGALIWLASWTLKGKPRMVSIATVGAGEREGPGQAFPLKMAARGSESRSGSRLYGCRGARRGHKRHLTLRLLLAPDLASFARRSASSLRNQPTSGRCPRLFHKTTNENPTEGWPRLPIADEGGQIDSPTRPIGMK